MSFLPGVDISQHQGRVNFDVLARKVCFMYIRGAVAKDQDDLLERNVVEAIKAGVPYGLYFAVKPDKSWIEQAAYHADLWKRVGGAMPPACDFELTGGLNKGDLLAWITKYLQGGKGGPGFEDLTGQQMIMYTSAGFMDRVELSGSDGLWRRKLWVANYTTGSKPLMPPEWTNHKKTWTFWQWSAGGNGLGDDYGAESADIDLDRYAGSVEDFEQEFGVKPNEPGELPPIPGPDTVVVSNPNVNVRNDPLLNESTIVGKLSKGAKLDVIGQEGNWWVVKLYVNKSVAKPG